MDIEHFGERAFALGAHLAEGVHLERRQRRLRREHRVVRADAFLGVGGDRQPRAVPIPVDRADVEDYPVGEDAGHCEGESDWGV